MPVLHLLFPVRLLKAIHQQFDELKPKVDKLVNAQKKLVTQILADAKKLIADNKNEEGGLASS